MTCGGLTTTPPVRSPFRPGRSFALHVFPRACGCARGIWAEPPLAEIEQNDWNLNFSLYMDTSEEKERIDVAETVRKLRGPEQARASAETSMNRYLAELGFG